MQRALAHNPALLDETLELLDPAPGEIIVDATVGAGGHAKAILEHIREGGLLIGIDRDADALSVADDILKDYRGRFKLIHSNFRNIKEILRGEGIEKVDGILFDLGISSLQLDDASRGFSFSKRGPLDMRMDRDQKTSAADLVNKLSEDELAGILRGFGEERYSGRISRAILNARRRNSVETTAELRDIIICALPHRAKGTRIDPATRTFQALRIAVNDELNALEGALADAPYILRYSGRACVISFHSLEDRIVKNRFKRFAQEGIMRLVNKKPIGPRQDEVRSNPRIRSAKLRAAEKTDVSGEARRAETE